MLFNIIKFDSESIKVKKIGWFVKLIIKLLLNSELKYKSNLFLFNKSWNKEKKKYNETTKS